MMKSFLRPILLSIFTLFLFVSCDKMDCNDGLDGQWQMREWKLPSGELKGGKEMKIYYSFQLQMMMFQQVTETGGQRLSSFEHCGTHIRIYDPIRYAGAGHDEILPMTDLSRFGVPLDGIMKIEQLSGSTLVLSSDETGTLTFRKY